MRTALEMEHMIDTYQDFMVKPLAEARLEWDEYDKLEFIHNYDPRMFNVNFRVIRKRPDKNVIDKMFCELCSVSVWEIERWYDSFQAIIRDCWKWKWEHYE